MWIGLALKLKVPHGTPQRNPCLRPSARHCDEINGASGRHAHIAHNCKGKRTSASFVKFVIFRDYMIHIINYFARHFLPTLLLQPREYSKVPIALPLQVIMREESAEGEPFIASESKIMH